MFEVSNSTASFGCAKNFVHKVKLCQDVAPVQQKLCRLPFSVRDAVSTEINRLLAADVIERVDASPWVSPIVVTQKKSGDIRMCVDLREPNKTTVVDSYPIPHIEELFSQLKGAVLFSTIDLANAYHQVPLHEDSRDLTAFITHEGLFRYKRVCYGLASALAAFQKLMSTILKEVPGVQCYLDDVIVFGDSTASHDAHLSTVLHKLREAGLRLNEQKCKFRQEKLTFLGHTISKEGLMPDNSHLEAIRNAPPPLDASMLRSFLGLTAWYAKFILNFSAVVEPMRDVLRENSDFTWTINAQKSFQKVKELIAQSSALALFDPVLPTIVTTDASDYGIGGVLTQLHPDKSERTVAFASRALTTTERKYSVVEKEALACVWTTERWRTYLWGITFKLRSDHTLLTTKGMGRAGLRVARWSARLLCFNYDMEYKRGTDNQVADCLSRLPLPNETNPDEDSEPETVAAVSTLLSAVPLTKFAVECSSCPELAKLRKYVKNGWPATAKTLPDDVIPYFPVRDELLIHDSYVLRGTHRLIVPLSLHSRLVTLAHECQQGIVRTKQRLRELYWWPKMDLQVQSTIATCVTCQLHDKTARTTHAPLTPVQYPEGPWQKLGMDVVGPFEIGPASCRYAITLIDYYSKWPEVAFTSNVTAATVTSFLTSFFSQKGNPLEIVTDNGPQFLSSEFKHFLKERDVKHICTSIYHPEGNGAVERWNKVLKDAILTAQRENAPWTSFVVAFLQTYRATPHATTGTSPFELLFGRKMRTKLSILTPCNMTPAKRKLKTKVKKKQQKMKAYLDIKRKANIPKLKEGDCVRVRKPTHVKKGTSKFSDPMQIIRRRGKYSYELSDGRTWDVSHLAPLHTDFWSAEQPISVSTSESVARSTEGQRVRRKPIWLKDYIT